MAKKEAAEIIADQADLDAKLDEAFDEEVPDDVAEKVEKSKGKEEPKPKAKAPPDEDEEDLEPDGEVDDADDGDEDEEGDEETGETVGEDEETDEGLTEEEVKALTKAGLSAVRIMKLDKMPAEARQATIETVLESLPSKSEGTEDDEPKKAPKITSEMIEKVAPKIPEDVIEEFADQLGVEKEKVRKFAVAIRDGAVEPLIKTAQAMATAVQKQRDYTTMTVYGIAARNVRIRMAADFPQLEEDKHFLAVTGDESVMNLADSYAAQGMTLVEASEKAISEGVERKWGKGKKKASAKRRGPRKRKGTGDDYGAGTPEPGGTTKKVFKGKKPETGMDFDDLLDAGFDEFNAKRRD